MKTSKKEYWIEDAIKEMRLSPTKKFTRNEGKSFIEYDIEKGGIVWKGEKQRGQFVALAAIRDTWVEYIPKKPIKPMTFYEILEIISKHGNSYWVEVETKNQKYKNYLSNVLIEMADEEESRNMSEYMKDGEWYLVNCATEQRMNYKEEI